MDEDTENAALKKTSENILTKERIEKKLRLSSELYEFALVVKMTALKRKYPLMSDEEIKKKAVRLIEKANSD